jgi:actin-like ATPase involved in cell morphogenesis
MEVEDYGLGVGVGSRTVTAAVCRWTGVPPPPVVDVVPSAGPEGHLPGAASDLLARALSRVGGPPLVATDGRPIPGAAVVADVVAEVCAAAAAREGLEPAGVVVAVPPSWGDHRRGLLQEALDAVLGVPSTVVSSAEAVVGAHVADGRLAPRSVVAVYDLGASTLDTAVVEVDDQGSTATRSVPPAPLRWGSRDLDDALVDLVRAGLEPSPAELGGEVLLALRTGCAAAKETLSHDTVTRVEFDLPEAGRASVRLTREDVEELLADPIARTVEVLRSTLAGAGLAPEDLDAVVVAGGCGAAPFVVERLSAELGRPVVLDDAPSATAARGAAHLAFGLLPADGAGIAGDLVEDAPVGNDAAARADRPGRRHPSRSRPRTAPGGAPNRPAGRRRRVGLQRGAVLLAVAGALLLIPTTSFDIDGPRGTTAGDRQAAQAAEPVAGPSPAAADAAATEDAPAAEDPAPGAEETSSTGSDGGSGAGGAAPAPTGTDAAQADETVEPPSTSGTPRPPASGSPTGRPTSNPTSSTDPPPTTDEPTMPPPPTTPTTEAPTTPPPPTDPPAGPSDGTTEQPPPSDPPPGGEEAPPPAAGAEATQQTPPSETTTTEQP